MKKREYRSEMVTMSPTFLAFMSENKFVDLLEE